MQAQPWITRLKDSVTALRVVAGAAALAGVRDEIRTTPAAWVMLMDEQAGGNQLVTAISQHIAVRMAVVIAVRNVRDARGEEASNDLEPIRDAIKTALLGWSPDANSDPVIYGRGNLLQLSDQTLWWQDEFLTAYYLRAFQ